MSGAWRDARAAGGVWNAYVDMRLDRLLSDGRYADATDVEIVGELARGAPFGIQFSDFERRKLLEEVSQRRAASMPTYPEATEEAVQAEMARRVEAGEETSYGALAKHFGVNKTKIRRRLGVLR